MLSFLTLIDFLFWFPLFADAYNSFLPFYMETLEQHVEDDICKLKVNIYLLDFFGNNVKYFT